MAPYNHTLYLIYSTKFTDFNMEAANATKIW